MADGKGECCIARWGGGHVTDRYNTSKMDMIMLKYRPIAPKPVVGSAAVSGTSEGCTTLSTGSGGQQAKAGAGRGRKKTCSRGKKNNNNNNNNSGGTSVRKCTNNGRKRKSSSPENHDDYQKHDYHDEGDQMAVNEYQKADLTLLPLFPEAPDLSPTSQVQNIVPFWLNFENTNGSPCFEDNYSHCHRSWW